MTGRKGAVIDGKYRYLLWRRWGDDGCDMLRWVMLNPSTADASSDDPTIRRCIGYAKREGYGGLVVLNLFALRATSPLDLTLHTDPVGPRNDDFLREYALDATQIVCAWGTKGAYLDREGTVLRLLREIALDKCVRLGTLTRGGHPRHPLYLRKDTPFEPMF